MTCWYKELAERDVSKRERKRERKRENGAVFVCEARSSKGYSE